MKKFITFAAWAIPVALLAWFAYTLIQHTKPQKSESQKICVTVDFNNKPEFGKETVETTRQVPVFCPFSGEAKTSEVKTVVKTTKSEPSERRVVITEDAFKETMQKVAYAVRREAQSEYDKNFSILLTILTIFGIAWPIIIALLQFKFNENELEKIHQSCKKSECAISKANFLNEQVAKHIDITKQLSNAAQEAHMDTLKRVQILFDTNNIAFSSMAVGNTNLSDYYYVLALRCSVWSIQATKELGVSKEDLESIIANIKLIQPHNKICGVEDRSCEMLIKIREDLQKNITVNGEMVNLTIQIFTLLDEKIAAYEKLLAAANNNNK